MSPCVVLEQDTKLPIVLFHPNNDGSLSYMTEKLLTGMIIIIK